MGFTTNYTGRGVDLSILAAIPPNGTTPAVLDFADPAEVVAGPQLAVQNWLVMFLTRKGTVVGDVEFGTDFLTQLLRGQLNDDLQVEQAFAVAADDIRRYVATHSDGTELDDETITAAALLEGWGWVGRDTLNLRIGLTLRSGAVKSVLVPVPVVIA